VTTVLWNSQGILDQDQTHFSDLARRIMSHPDASHLQTSTNELALNGESGKIALWLLVTEQLGEGSFQQDGNLLRSQFRAQTL
jgi:hypothetical protein